MKKRTKILSAVTLAGLLLAGCAASAAQVERIEQNAAKAAAFADAGVDASEVRVTSLELDRKNGVEYYEVDFVAEGAKYEYDIDALTGKVITFEVEKKGEPMSVRTTPASEEKKTPAAENPETGITEEEAKKIALSQVPGADESHIYKFHIDHDDGRLEYEGSIIFEEMEYDFEIDGHSGAIRDWEAESIYD